jgi:integrase
VARQKLRTPNYRLRLNRQGYYELQWTDVVSGKTKFKTTGTKDPNEAQRVMGGIIATMGIPKPSPAITIAAVADAYLIATPQEHVALRPVKERLGSLQPTQLNDAVAKSYAEWRQQAGAKDGSIIRELCMLRASMRWGARNGLGYTGMQIGNFKMPVKRPAPQDRWLTREECHKLIYQGCVGDDQRHVRLFVRLALTTGQRTGAILGLTWDRVHIPAELESWLATAMPSVVSNTKITFRIDDRKMPMIVVDFGAGEGNKRRSRHTPLGDNTALARELIDAKKRAQTDYVIEWNGQPVKSVKTSLRGAYKRAGITNIRRPAHLLRHSACTLMVMAGLSYERIGKHVNMRADMVESTYGHHSPEFLHAVGNITSF